MSSRSLLSNDFTELKLEADIVSHFYVSYRKLKLFFLSDRNKKKDGSSSQLLGDPCIPDYRRVIWAGTIALSISNLPREYAILIVPGDRRRTPPAIPLFPPSVLQNRSSLIFPDGQVVRFSSLSFLLTFSQYWLQKDKDELSLETSRKDRSIYQNIEIIQIFLQNIIFLNLDFMYICTYNLLIFFLPNVKKKV